MTEIAQVINPKKIVTDPLALKTIVDRGLDPSYVEFWKDYTPTERDLLGVAKHYRDRKTGVCFAVIGQRPHFNEDGLRIEPRWYAHDGGYVSGFNRFASTVAGKATTYSCAKGDAAWSPQVFLDGEEVMCGDPVLLDGDPINENYHQNTLEWDYGICKRRLRIIEGQLRERYFFFADPGGGVKIKSNWIGTIESGPDFARDNLGRRIDVSSEGDTETIPREEFRAYLFKHYPDDPLAGAPEYACKGACNGCGRCGIFSDVARFKYGRTKGFSTKELRAIKHGVDALVRREVDNGLTRWMIPGLSAAQCGYDVFHNGKTVRPSISARMQKDVLPEFRFPIVVASSPETYDNPGIDGHAYHTGVISWQDSRDGAGTGYDSSSDSAFAYSTRVGMAWSIYRMGITWNTAALPDDCVITGAIVYAYGSVKHNDQVAPTLNIYSFAPAGNTALEAGDFNAFGTAAYCDTAVTYAGFSTAGYNSFTLNATGIAVISKTSYTRMGLREATSDVADSDPVLSKEEYTGFEIWCEEKGSGYEPKIVITYTVPAAPTVTTQAASAVEVTTATGNGNITATGGSNATRRGFCYMTGTSGDPTTANSVAYDDGSYGTGAYTKGLTGLSAGTSYRVRAYAVNSVGTSYGVTVQILTKPAAPTNVAASENDGTKVVVAWTKSTGATAYQIYRVSTALGWLGDVATGEDTGGAAPVITPGAAVASDGTSLLHVTLSLSGESIANGTTYAYKVRAKNATGESADSATDNGYRDAQTVTYQWQRSSGDSDADYSNISGGTTDPYNDTGAPENGDGRYFKCVQDATGSVQATSSVDRGYRDAVTSSIKTVFGTPIAEIKTINGVAIADVKSWLGVSNVD